MADSSTSPDTEGDADRSDVQESADAEEIETDSDVDTTSNAAPDGDEPTDEELLAEIESQYDFDDFGPSDMAEMSVDEWEAAFDADSWITGAELIDRVEQELLARIAQREVFAVLERVDAGEGDELLLAYSDQDYALIYPDGGVEGTGTVLRDVKPSIALCSMEEYDPQIPPEGDFLLPHPDEVPEQSSEIGNLMIQLIAGAQLLAAVGLIGVSLYFGVTGSGGQGTALITGVAGFAFGVIALFLFVTVANARLSDRFRSEEYRGRLRSIGLEDGERPDFLPIEDPDAQLRPVRERNRNGD
ncbi:DUF7319 domain-containing protein [Natranaeroarchaeum aerophilus]|uniref:DUF7319 domain-containing protein n=1 Tax=Natranaeroarchaeum aerophilus TaxID=2917711 RepID=A0AAE3FTB3_9EURY|nr:hypothetical protein [Natranaeroarchaeum aerophilus]MCL9814929.1 hypothetical protein [Natranaeroarchaeum aerophilus]